MSEEIEGFSAGHHALLFGYLTKAVFEVIGPENGEAVIRKAVRQYGRERGRRMALRARANDHSPTMANFLAYGEWSAPEGEMEQVMVTKIPNAEVQVVLCPWANAWKENDLLPFGRFYCLEIDHALIKGFNPDLRLDVISTLTNDADQCDFIYHQANLSFINTILLGYRKKYSPGGKARMSWEYHAGHLFTTMEKVIVAELGKTGEQAMQAGLKSFGAKFGEEAARLITEYRGVDFDVCINEDKLVLG
jgi:hypothetical protein